MHHGRFVYRVEKAEIVQPSELWVNRRVRRDPPRVKAD